MHSKARNPAALPQHGHIATPGVFRVSAVPYGPEVTSVSVARRVRALRLSGFQGALCKPYPRPVLMIFDVISG